MKLPEHVENIRQLIDKAFRNRLGRMGIEETKLIPAEQIPNEYLDERTRMENILEVLVAETGSESEAYEKLVEELTFTLFNRIAAMKVMEAHTLLPEIITRRETHGGRSFALLVWLEQNPGARGEEGEGLMSFFEEQLVKLKEEIPLFSPQHPYHLLPTTIELLRIIEAFNKLDSDSDLLLRSSNGNDVSIWESDEQIRQTDEIGNEFWSARDLAKALEYSEYRHFMPVIERAKEACVNSGQQIADHFEDILEMITTGKTAQRAVESVKLSRYACYLIVQNADPGKEVVALGQTYFAVQTRLQEIQQMDEYNRLSTEDEKLSLQRDCNRGR